MKIRRSSSTASLAIAAIASLVAVSALAQSQPKLVVGIVVEGLHKEYIDLLRENFTAGGFNRLIDQGVTIEDVDFGTPLDATAATTMIYTGAEPAINGIPAAETFDRSTLRPVDVLTDPAAMGNYTNQTFSPAALAVSTLADELRIAGGGVTYAYSIAPTPAQSVIMTGHAGNCGIWLNDATGNWATTTYYKDVPSVLTQANRLRPLSQRIDTMQWVPMLPADRYVLLPDHLTHYPFRHVFRAQGQEKIDMFMGSPMLNSEITALAEDHIKSLALGSHDGVDMLNIALSLRPYGYSKNPDNRFEIYDSYFRLDRDLAKLLTAIDRSVGSDRSVVFLAGTPRSPRSRRDDERWLIPYGEFSARKAMSLLNVYLIAVHGNGDWVQGYHNGQIFLNSRLISERGVDPAEIRAESAAFLSRMSGVKDATSLDKILSTSDARARNTVASAAGDIFINVLPGWEIIDDFNNTPARARTGQVERIAASTAPFFIMAPGVAPKKINTTVDARTIAPTVARVLRIRSPNAASLPPLPL